MINSSGTNLDREAARGAAESREGVRNLTRHAQTGLPPWPNQFRSGQW